METVTTPSVRATVWRPVLIATVPLLGAWVVAVWLLANWAFGGTPFWPTPELNLSEAAAVSDTGEVYRLITYEKKDPNAPWPIRAGLLVPTAVTMTPLEAGLEGRRFQVVRLLMYHGATLDAAQRTAFICRAEVLADPETVNFLLTTGDRSDPRPCPPPPSNP